MTSVESTDSAQGVILARNRRQAMDWSLVLISQGIESVVEPSEDAWMLQVQPPDHARALAMLRQYQLENRGWRWHASTPWPPVTFHFGAVAWSLLLALVHFLNAISGGRWQGVGVMDPTAVQNGAWWRLFTATLLHFDLAHLMANLAIGLPVMGLAMSRYGPACAWLAAYLAGAAGNVAGLLLHTQPRPALGASGMVMGGLGLLTIQSLSLRFQDAASRKYIVGGILAGVMLFTLLGLDPTSDVLAHAGGFVSGLILGAALTFVPRNQLSGRPVNTICAAIVAGLITLTWTMAFRQSPPGP